MRLFSFVLLFILSIVCVAQAQKTAKVTLITAADVSKGITEPIIDITGSAFFTMTSDVAAESASKIVKVFVKDGDIIDVNAPIAQLDDEMLTFSIASATAKTHQSSFTLDKMKRDYERSKSLYDQHSMSQQQYENAYTDYKNAELAYNAAVTDENKLKAEKNKMIIKAPFKGVITDTVAKVGEWISVGGTVASMASLTYEAQIYLPEKVLPFIKAGQKVPVITSNKNFIGTVLSINPKGDPATRMFIAKINIGSDPTLKEGVKTVIRVPSGKREEALFVPRDAIIEKNFEKGVYKIIEDSVIFVPIKIVGYSGANTAIEGELKIGDKVVIKGNDRISNGSKIQITAN